MNGISRIASICRQSQSARSQQVQVFSLLHSHRSSRKRENGFDRNARLMNKGQRDGTIQVNTYLSDFHTVEVGSSGSISGSISGGLDSAP